VFVLDHGHGLGHVGIVEAVVGDGTIVTVEGNTNAEGSREGDRVARHRWAPALGRRGALRGYIDLGRLIDVEPVG
jgi:surface antigen